MLHLTLTRFAEEKILRLSETKVAAHEQRFLREIWRGFASRHRCDKGEQVFINPRRLLEILAGQFGTFPVEVHVASLPHVGRGIIEKTRVHLDERQLRLLLDLGKCTIPRKCNIHICLQKLRLSLP